MSFFQRVAETYRSITNINLTARKLMELDDLDEVYRPRDFEIMIRDKLKQVGSYDNGTEPIDLSDYLKLVKYLQLMVNLHTIKINIEGSSPTTEQTTNMMNILCNLPKLENIIIKGNIRVNRIPDAISNLTKLKVLIINLGNESQVSENLYNLTTLKSLVFCENLREISPNIRNLTNLEVLRFIRTPRLTSLPETIFQLQNLNYFTLSNTRVSSLPENISNLTSLSTLELDSSPISILPNGITNCIKLKRLEITDCPITSLPETIGNLRNLEVIRISNTQITEIPLSFYFLTKIKKLILTNNRIPTIALNTIRNSPLVQNLLERYANSRDYRSDFRNLTETIDIRQNQFISRPSTSTPSTSTPPTSTPSAPSLASSYFTYQNVFNITESNTLEESESRANPNHEGYDLINLENVKVSDYLNQDPDNVIFYMNGKILLLSDKNNMRNIILNSPSIKYRCIAEGTTLVPRLDNVDTENPYVSLNSLGSTSGGLVLLGDIKSIIEDPSVRIIEIVTPEISNAVSTASLQILGPNPNALAASHCQAGQGDKIYALKKMLLETTGGKKRQTKKRQRI